MFCKLPQAAARHLATLTSASSTFGPIKFCVRLPNEMELIKVHDHKSVLLLHCTDMQALIAFMSTPEMKQWDAENNCVDVLYSMEQMN